MLSINESTDGSINRTKMLSINQSTKRACIHAVNQSKDGLLNQSINQAIKQLTNQWNKHVRNKSLNVQLNNPFTIRSTGSEHSAALSRSSQYSNSSHKRYKKENYSQRGTQTNEITPQKQQLWLCVLFLTCNMLRGSLIFTGNASRVKSFPIKPPIIFRRLPSARGRGDGRVVRRPVCSVIGVCISPSIPSSSSESVEHPSSRDSPLCH